MNLENTHRQHLTHPYDRRFWPGALCIVLALASCSVVQAQEWPTYRGDANRSGITVDAVRPPLSLNWKYVSPHPPKPAWPMPAEEMPRTHYDNAFHVAIAGGSVYFGSSVTDEAYAIDAATGAIRWSFAAEGPVRFAPSVYENRVYFGSDDGYAYCLDADSGALIWRYRPGPSDEKVIGNGRMISLWPVRTSVLVVDGVAYFAAGVFPYEGIYICALDAGNGAVVWKNDTIGDHAPELEYGGISPHGYILASKDMLYVPSGRSMPAAFDRKTGAFAFCASPGAKQGGVWALLDDDQLIAGVDLSGTPHKEAYDAKTGKSRGDMFGWFPGIDMVLTRDASYVAAPEGVYGFSRAVHAEAAKQAESLKRALRPLKDKMAELRGELRAATSPTVKDELSAGLADVSRQIYELAEREERLRAASFQWHHPQEGLAAIVLAGDTVFAGGDGYVIGLDHKSGREIWRAKVRGRAVGLAPAARGLVVSTDVGGVYCFGPDMGVAPKTVSATGAPDSELDETVREFYASAAEIILRETSVARGYCLVLDCGTGQLASELARYSDLYIVGIETDLGKCREARERLAAAGLLGVRAAVEPWDLSALPDCFANLIVSEGMLTSGRTDAPREEIQRLLRPWGGIAYLGAGKGRSIRWTQRRRGPLDGAGSWTQQFGNPANTACSGDELVKGPLGVLWFGGPGPEGMVERHAKPASPVAMNGRLFVQGGEVIMAYDGFNGAFLWQREIPGAVRVRADADGGNLALAEEGLYVAAHDRCLRLDLDTGDTLRIYEAPPCEDGSPRRWGWVARAGGLLFGTRAMPLRTEYAAIWKELSQEEELPEPEEMDHETREVLQQDLSLWEGYEDFRATYEDVDEEVLRDFQRAGTHWRIVADFPEWENYRPGQGSVSDLMMVSDLLFAMDPDTGDIVWAYPGKRIANITVSIGDGTVFLAESDVTEAERQEALADRRQWIERGLYQEWPGAGPDDIGADVRLVVAIEAKSGKVLWRKPVDLTGCCGDAMGTAFQDGLLFCFGNVGNHDAWRFRDGEMRYKRITALSARDGRLVWSRPLNYRTRPVIMKDRIIIEPRACDPRTGAILTRAHPITGQETPWEFLRPGHTCALSSASADVLFYRSASTAYYDIANDRGVTAFGGVRPGCLINMVPAGGLLLFPEASSGCTCSYPIRCSLAMMHKPRRPQPWTVFIAHGSPTPAAHFAVNFGAPADMKDEKGVVWFAYPNPKTRRYTHFPNYGVKFNLHDEISAGPAYFCRDFRDVAFEGTERPWLFTSGCQGAFCCEIPLIADVWGESPGEYTVRLGFMAPEGDSPGRRVFDVRLQDALALEAFDIAAEAGAPNRAVVKEFKDIPVTNVLKIELVPRALAPTQDDAPTINFIEAVREDPPPARKRAKRAALSAADAEELLADAVGDAPDEALQKYHEVFDRAASVVLRCKALEGMAAIGSPESLSRITPYCRDTAPILRNYEDVPPELRDAAMRVYIAASKTLALSQREEAVRMLEQGMEMCSKTMRSEVIAALESLGVEIGRPAAEEGFVTRWSLIGPFPWEEKNHPTDARFVGEPNVDLTGAYTALDGKGVGWQRYVAERAMVDLVDFFGPSRDCAVYAYAEFHLDEDRDILLKIGSNDGFKCWFNGQEVGRFEEGRGYKPDQNVYSVAGRKGANTVLLKVLQMGGGWACSARITGLDDIPIRYREKPLAPQDVRPAI